MCRRVVVFKGGLCEIQKRESQCSYLAFLDISKTLQCLEGWFVAQDEAV